MSGQDVGAGYAYWTAPDGSRRIVYSLELFHELDFLANEAFRRIPHGGIETGGLLFGRQEDSTLRVEAFRPIECEHAAGPSFVLSERDVEGIRELARQAGSDPELSGLQLLGWFIAHTRNPLLLNDREAALFDQLFPEQQSITVLIKPARFEPTRFAFLLRTPDHAVERDGTSRAIILPLPGRTAGPESAGVASIPAPEKPATPPVTRPAEPTAPAEKPEVTATPPIAERPSEPRIEVETAPPSRLSESVERPVPPPPAFSPSAPGQPAAYGAPTRIVGRSPETTPPVTVPRPPEPPPARPSRDFPAAASSASTRAVPYTPLAGSAPPTRPVRQLAVPQPRLFGWRFASILVLAAVLGCVAGYWCYLQLPSPVIPLSLRQQGGRIILSWPAAQTSSVDYAAVRVNDGEAKALTAQEKSAGELSLNDTDGDIKIELVAQHWLRDSRGIVRYLKAPRAGDTAPPK
jgi:hypothetical protein